MKRKKIFNEIVSAVQDILGASNEYSNKGLIIRSHVDLEDIKIYNATIDINFSINLKKYMDLLERLPTNKDRVIIHVISCYSAFILTKINAK